MIPTGAFILALSDAANGHGILFLTLSAREAESAVVQCRHAGITFMRNSGITQNDAEAAVRRCANPWRLEVGFGGWVLFYPEPEVEQDSDVGSPKYVYVPNGDTYSKVNYDSWRVSGVRDESQDPDRPVTKWTLLLEDDP